MPARITAGSYQLVDFAISGYISSVIDLREYNTLSVWFQGAFSGEEAVLLVSNLKDGYYVPLYNEDGSMVGISNVHCSGYIRLEPKGVDDVLPACYGRLWSYSEAGVMDGRQELTHNILQTYPRSLIVMCK